MGYSVNGGVVQLAGQDPGAVAAIWSGGDCRRGILWRPPAAALLFWKWIISPPGQKTRRCGCMRCWAIPVIRASPKFRALIAFHEHIFASLQHQQWAKARALIAQCRKLSGVEALRLAKSGPPNFRDFSWAPIAA